MDPARASGGSRGVTRSILDTAVRTDRPRVRRRLRRLAMTAYRTAMREGISPASDAALSDLGDAIPGPELLILQMTSRRAAS